MGGHEHPGRIDWCFKITKNERINGVERFIPINILMFKGRHEHPGRIDWCFKRLN